MPNITIPVDTTVVTPLLAIVQRAGFTADMAGGKAWITSLITQAIVIDALAEAKKGTASTMAQAEADAKTLAAKIG